MWRWGARRRKEPQAGPEQPAYLTGFIRPSLSLYSLHLSGEWWDWSCKMHVTSELLIVLFISLSYREDVSLKNHEWSWFRCRVHQNVVPVTADWLCRKSLLLWQSNLTCPQVNRSYLLPVHIFLSPHNTLYGSRGWLPVFSMFGPMSRHAENQMFWWFNSCFHCVLSWQLHVAQTQPVCSKHCYTFSLA